MHWSSDAYRIDAYLIPVEIGLEDGVPRISKDALGFLLLDKAAVRNPPPHHSSQIPVMTAGKHRAATTQSRG